MTPVLFFNQKQNQANTSDIILPTEAGPITVVRRINSRATKLILRIDIKTGAPTVTVPKGVKEKQVIQFVHKHTDWIQEQLQATAQSTLEHREYIYYRGDQHRLLYTNTPPRKITITSQTDKKTIIIGGPQDQANKRLERWLKERARQYLEHASKNYADHLGVHYDRISIGDMKSRWGSCSSKKNIRYNWRLIMAPKQVLDYVAAHEVSHLLEMNHSDRFWAHVKSCMPDYAQHRKWLRSKGQDLMTLRF